jgi:hypothetical protein
MKVKGSTIPWFGMFFAAFILGWIANIVGAYIGWYAGAAFVWICIGLGFIISIYAWWKAAEIVSGHEKIIVEKYEAVGHKDSKDSTLKWFIIFLIPVVNLYFLWKLAEAISGHERIFIASEEA